MRFEPSLYCKAFTTHITDVRLLSSVGPYMISQSSWSSELLWTQVTLVRLVTTVSELVLDEVKRLDAGKITLITFERFLACNKNYPNSIEQDRVSNESNLHFDSHHR